MEEELSVAKNNLKPIEGGDSKKSLKSIKPSIATMSASNTSELPPAVDDDLTIRVSLYSLWFQTYADNVSLLKHKVVTFHRI